MFDAQVSGPKVQPLVQRAANFAAVASPQLPQPDTKLLEDQSGSDQA